MEYNQIVELLKSKSLNLHYVLRYFNFLEYCSKKSYGSSFESHHILPKAIFPEYKSAKLCKWNIIKLTPRQHFIAHWILWKAMGGTMAYAFFAMKRKSKHQKDRYFKMSSRVYEKLRSEVAFQQSTRIISDETRKRMSIGQKNKPKIECPHCKKVGTESNMRRWHFDNCKTLTGILKHNVKQNHEIITCPHCLKQGKAQGMYANHFDNCSLFKNKPKKEKVECPHCGKCVTNYKNFTDLHFDNCPSFTGIKREQSPAEKAANIKRSISLKGKPKPRKSKVQKSQI